LEYLTSQYRLNPRPKVILAVEGKGESEQFPRLLSALWGLTPGKLGIEIVNIGGSGNFVGNRRERLGAWARLIDYHHHHNTVVFVVLDKLGKVEAVRDRLSEAQSHHDPERAIHKSQYFRIWDSTVELDNFGPHELAFAMTAVTGVEFESEEMADLQRRARGSGVDELNAVCTRKFGKNYQLDKARLLEILVDYAIADPMYPSVEPWERHEPRGIVKLLQKVVAIATSNPQPPGTTIRALNQRSGFFGDPYEKNELSP